MGIGMLCDLGSVLAVDGEGALFPGLVRSKKTVAQIRKLVEEKGAVLADGYGYSIYRCPKCSRIYGRFFIHLDLEGGTYEIDYKCSKCRVSLKRVDIQGDSPDYGGPGPEAINSLACPKCGKMGLSLMSVMVLWD